MNETTKTTRSKSLEKEKEYIPTRVDQIIYILVTNGEMTAREIEEKREKLFEPHFFDLNHVRPRLTELLEAEKIEVVGTKEDQITHTRVAIYKKRRLNYGKDE